MSLSLYRAKLLGVQVGINAFDLSKPADLDGRMEVWASRWVLHPDYTPPPNVQNDIALIKIPSIRGILD
jgi:hypothetical protein